MMYSLLSIPWFRFALALASYLMALAPAILAYALAQRWVISGVTQGAVKG